MVRRNQGVGLGHGASDLGFLFWGLGQSNLAGSMVSLRLATYEAGLSGAAVHSDVEPLRQDIHTMVPFRKNENQRALPQRAGFG